MVTIFLNDGKESVFLNPKQNLILKNKTAALAENFCFLKEISVE